jgi:hypothetical protein
MRLRSTPSYTGNSWKCPLPSSLQGHSVHSSWQRTAHTHFGAALVSARECVGDAGPSSEMLDHRRSLADGASKQGGRHRSHDSLGPIPLYFLSLLCGFGAVRAARKQVKSKMRVLTRTETHSSVEMEIDEMEPVRVHRCQRPGLSSLS